MTDTLGDFGDKEKEGRQPDETVAEFYCRLRDSQIAEGTKANFITPWSRLQDYLKSNHPNKSAFDLEVEDVKDWYQFLSEDGVKETTIKTYASNVVRILDDLRSENYISGTHTPFVDAKDSTDWNKSRKEFLEVPFDEFISSINRIKSPIRLVVIALFAKTGIRLSELTNLDERDVVLEHPISSALDDPRYELQEISNAIYIDSSIKKYKKHNGVVRRYPNKHSSTRTIPIDDELVELLGWYLSMRTIPESPAKPIFVAESSSGNKTNEEYVEHDNRPIIGVGTRRSPAAIRDEIYAFAKKNGYYRKGKRRGMYPHWFRHFFVTQMRANTNQDEIPIGTVKQFAKGLRGDSDADTIDTYTHKWDDALQRSNEFDPYDVVVRRNMPKLLASVDDSS